MIVNEHSLYLNSVVDMPSSVFYLTSLVLSDNIMRIIYKYWVNHVEYVSYIDVDDDTINRYIRLMKLEQLA